MKKLLVGLVVMVVLGMNFGGVVHAAAPQAKTQETKATQMGASIPIPKEGRNAGCPSRPDAETLKGMSLGLKIKCGVVELSDVPRVIVGMIDGLLAILGTISVIMIMVGGIQYMIGGITDDKERGKKTVIYALSGLTIALLSWILIGWLQSYLTDDSAVPAKKSTPQEVVPAKPIKSGVPANPSAMPSTVGKKVISPKEKAKTQWEKSRSRMGARIEGRIKGSEKEQKTLGCAQNPTLGRCKEIEKSLKTDRRLLEISKQKNS